MFKTVLKSCSYATNIKHTSLVLLRTDKLILEYRYKARTRYNDQERDYQQVFINDLMDEIEEDATDDKIELITQKFKQNIVSRVNVGEISSAHRLEAQILKKAVDSILHTKSTKGEEEDTSLM